MLKKLFLAIAILAVIAAYLSGVFTMSFSPFSININKPEKDILKYAAQKLKGIIYREATEHNPPGDVLPDQIDDKIKQEAKERIN
ncbi:MAG: hypothetical protein A3J76_03755 [Candidatus Moranbacteria bacterium RBG_13_45_13]|nr:MAG: hypothetical protein A3J76_03755 [Candidatus Moranbacteria bacterium RBG_13_45_13]